MKSVKLTELEFNKLVRLSESASYAQLKAQLEIKRITEAVRELFTKHDAYFKELSEKYEDLDTKVAYTPVEATCELTPNVVEG